MFPSPPTPVCPWCSRELETQPRSGECPHCGQPCGDDVYALDVFEGKSRPRLLLAVLGWFFVLLTGTVVLSALLGPGPLGDAVIFGLFFIVLLVIAGAETHGLLLIRRGTGSRRVIFTSQGVEMINPHRIAGVSSIEWEEVDAVDVEKGKGGGARITVTAHTGELGKKPAIKVITASTEVSPDEVRWQLDRVRPEPAAQG